MPSGAASSSTFASIVLHSPPLPHSGPLPDHDIPVSSCDRGFGLTCVAAPCCMPFLGDRKDGPDGLLPNDVLSHNLANVLHSRAVLPARHPPLPEKGVLSAGVGVNPTPKGRWRALPVSGWCYPDTSCNGCDMQLVCGHHFLNTLPRTKTTFGSVRPGPSDRLFPSAIRHPVLLSSQMDMVP